MIIAREVVMVLQMRPVGLFCLWYKKRPIEVPKGEVPWALYQWQWDEKNCEGALFFYAFNFAIKINIYIDGMI